MKFQKEQLAMIRFSLIFTFANIDEIWKQKARSLDPSEELDALSIHKKIGEFIQNKGTEDSKFIDGEVEFIESEKKLVHKFVSQLRLGVEELELKNEILELLK